MMKVVRHSSISRQSICLALFLTLVYSILLVMAAGCAFAHAGQAEHQHHHDEQGSSAKNSLCAWACQATADTLVVIGPPLSVAELVVERYNLISNPLICSISSSTVPSRAPPSIPFVRLG